MKEIPKAGAPVDQRLYNEAMLEIERLEQELKAAQKDAARYRFLRAESYSHRNVCLSICDDLGRGVCTLRPAELDAAVDAAIAGKNMNHYVQRVGLVPALGP
jgi:hypothetical protein